MTDIDPHRVYHYVRACVRACVRVCVRACVCDFKKIRFFY